MIKENIASVLSRINVACVRAGVTTDEVCLVAVTKGVAVERICLAIDCGIENIGENRIQEALLKYNEINRYAEGKGRRVKWHMIGHLQTNKAKDAVQMFDLIHSVDSARLAIEIDKQAGKINKIQDVLIEVNISGEVAKFGLKVEEVIKTLKEISCLKNISIKGLMTVAPIVDSSEQARPYFKMLRELCDEIYGLWTMDYGHLILSMGMTDDFEVAIEEGANLVRIGRGIFSVERLA